MSTKYALLARLEAKPGKEKEVAKFLEDSLPLARQEAGTTSWFALQLDEHTYGIFDTFNDEAGRQAHLDGKIATKLMDEAKDLLAKPPRIEKIDVLAAKLPH